MIDIFALPTVNALSDCVTLCQLDNVPVIRVNHPKAKAAISLFGGHVLRFCPAEQTDLLWLSDTADFSGNKAIRGGVPICWPWFGRAAEPAHGFVRTMEWALQEHRENEQGVIVCLSVTDNEATRAIWPHAFKLELFIEVSEQLTLSLVTSNTGNEAFTIGGALHSYVNIGDIKQTTVTQLGHSYLEKAAQHNSDGSAEFTGEVDRIYTNAATTSQINDKQNNRIIDVENTGNNAVVVWNPWQDIAKQMADMPDDGFLTMVCVESTMYDNAEHVLPGKQHKLTTKIRIKE